MGRATQQGRKVVITKLLLWCFCCDGGVHHEAEMAGAAWRFHADPEKRGSIEEAKCKCSCSVRAIEWLLLLLLLWLVTRFLFQSRQRNNLDNKECRRKAQLRTALTVAAILRLLFTCNRSTSRSCGRRPSGRSTCRHNDDQHRLRGLGCEFRVNNAQHRVMRRCGVLSTTCRRRIDVCLKQLLDSVTERVEAPDLSVSRDQPERMVLFELFDIS